MGGLFIALIRQGFIYTVIAVMIKHMNAVFRKRLPDHQRYFDFFGCQTYRFYFPTFLC
jgi:hypothetical protein